MESEAVIIVSNFESIIGTELVDTLVLLLKSVNEVEIGDNPRIEYIPDEDTMYLTDGDYTTVYVVNEDGDVERVYKCPACGTISYIDELKDTPCEACQQMYHDVMDGHEADGEADGEAEGDVEADDDPTFTGEILDCPDDIDCNDCPRYETCPYMDGTYENENTDE